MEETNLQEFAQDRMFQTKFGDIQMQNEVKLILESLVRFNPCAPFKFFYFTNNNTDWLRMLACW